MKYITLQNKYTHPWWEKRGWEVEKERNKYRIVEETGRNKCTKIRIFYSTL